MYSMPGIENLRAALAEDYPLIGDMSGIAMEKHQPLTPDNPARTVVLESQVAEFEAKGWRRSQEYPIADKGALAVDVDAVPELGSQDSHGGRQDAALLYLSEPLSGSHGEEESPKPAKRRRKVLK